MSDAVNYPKVLIIDDNESDRALALREIKKLFPQLKYWEIIDDKSFSEALQQQQFDLVITDYHLRWTTGLDILHRLKQQVPDCPVIMFTGTGNEEIAVEAMKAGLDDYVIKSPKHYLRLAVAVRSAWQKAQQKKALDTVKQTYDRFFERVPLGLYRLDPSGGIIEANSTLMQTLGASRIQDLLMQNLANYHLDTAAYFQWQQQLTKEKAVENWEGQIRTLDNRLIWVSHKAIAVTDSKNKVVCYEGAIADITANKQAELERITLLKRERQAKEEAEKLNRIKDEFLATLSHELRTPLNSIVGWIQLIRGGNLSQAQFDRAIKVIDRNAYAQNQLIEDLLDVSCIIRGTMSLELQPGDLTQVLTSSIDTVRPTATAKQIQLQTQLPTQNIEINLDAERLQQVFWNLLINAVKFTPVGGLVTIEAITEGDKVIIKITDTGQGIAADTLPYVFDRFRQAETKSSTRTQGGLGLGLAIVRHLVEIHGGQVTADSAGLGQGSTFTIELPLLTARPGDRLDDATDSLSSLPSLAGLTLLIVEDEADAREMITLTLEQCGAKVIVANSVKQAWNQYQQHQLDAIISDISMPLEDGYQLIKQIRNSQNNQSQIPAIALTAYARESDRQQALQAGFDLHVSKPINPFELLQSLTQLIQNSQR